MYKVLYTYSGSTVNPYSQVFKTWRFGAYLGFQVDRFKENKPPNRIYRPDCPSRGRLWTSPIKGTSSSKHIELAYKSTFRQRSLHRIRIGNMLDEISSANISIATAMYIYTNPLATAAAAGHETHNSPFTYIYIKNMSHILHFNRYIIVVFERV